MRAHILNINASEPIEVLGGAHVSQQRCNMAGGGIAVRHSAPHQSKHNNAA
jgi:hypothetical protein